MTAPNPFSVRLRALLARAGLSISDVVLRSDGLSRQALHGLLQGKTPDPRLSTLVKLADALGVPLDAFRP